MGFTMDPAKLSLNKFLEPGNEVINDELRCFLDQVLGENQEVTFSISDDKGHPVRSGIIMRISDGYEMLLTVEGKEQEIFLSSDTGCADQQWLELYENQGSLFCAPLDGRKKVDRERVQNQRVVNLFERDLQKFYEEEVTDFKSDKWILQVARYLHRDASNGEIVVGTVRYFKGDDENRAFVSIEEITNDGTYTYATLIKVGNEYIPVSDVANIYDRKGPQNAENPLATLLCERGIEPFQTAQSLGED
jgi:hypothetical protein